MTKNIGSCLKSLRHFHDAKRMLKFITFHIKRSSCKILLKELNTSMHLVCKSNIYLDRVFIFITYIFNSA